MATSSGSEKTLYARIGGYDTFAAIIDEFLQTAAAEPNMEGFANSMSLDSRRRNRQLTLDYLCAAAGPAFYLGKDMKSAHAGLAISSQEWRASMEHFERALKKFNVGAQESKEFCALIEDLRDRTSSASNQPAGRGGGGTTLRPTSTSTIRKHCTRLSAAAASCEVFEESTQAAKLRRERKTA